MSPRLTGYGVRMAGISTYTTTVQCGRKDLNDDRCEGEVSVEVETERETRDCPGSRTITFGDCETCGTDDFTQAEEDRMWGDVERGATA